MQVWSILKLELYSQKVLFPEGFPISGDSGKSNVQSWRWEFCGCDTNSLVARGTAEVGDVHSRLGPHAICTEELEKVMNLVRQEPEPHFLPDSHSNSLVISLLERRMFMYSLYHNQKEKRRFFSIEFMDSLSRF